MFLLPFRLLLFAFVAVAVMGRSAAKYFEENLQVFGELRLVRALTEEQIEALVILIGPHMPIFLRWRMRLNREPSFVAPLSRSLNR